MHYKKTRGSPEAVCQASAKALNEDEVGYWDQIAKACAWHLHDLTLHHRPLDQGAPRPAARTERRI